MHRSSLVFAVLLASFALTPPAPAAVPVDSVFQGFLPNGEYALEVGGAVIDGAKLYFSDKALCFLIVSDALPTPILVSPREKGVDAVPPASLSYRDDGTVDLFADAVFDRLTTFQIDGESVRFEVDGRATAVVPRPFLLGAQPGDVVFAYKPEYARNAAAYTPSASALRTLAASQGLRVRTFFGSWCPHCTQLMPRLMRVEQELHGRGPKFEYYGLPQQFGEEPEAKANGVHGVPTAIVYRDGKEIGRIGDWTAPDAAMVALLGSG